MPLLTTEMQIALFNAIAKGDETKVESLLSQSSIPSLEIIEKFSNEEHDLIMLSIPHPNIFKKLWAIYKDQISLDRKSIIFLYIVQQDNLELLNIIVKDKSIKKTFIFGFPDYAATILNKVIERKESARNNDEKLNYQLVIDKLLMIPEVALLNAVEKNNGMAVWLLLQVSHISHIAQTEVLEQAIRKGFAPVVKSLLHHCHKALNDDLKKKIINIICNQGTPEIWSVVLKSKTILNMLITLNANGNKILKKIRKNKEIAVAKEEQLRYQAIYNQCLQIPEMALFEALERNNEADVKSELLKKRNIDNALKEKILKESAKRNFCSVVSILLDRYPISEIAKKEIMLISLQSGYAGILNICLKKIGLKDSLLESLKSTGINFLDEIQESKENAINKEDVSRYQAVIDRLLEIPEAAFFNAVAENNKVEVLSLLFNNNIGSDFQEIAFIGAAKKGFSSILKMLLSHDRGMISRECKFNALYLTCYKGHLNATNVLLDDAFAKEIENNTLYRLYNLIQERVDNLANMADLQQRCQNILNRLLEINAIRQLVQRAENDLSNAANAPEGAMATLTRAETALIQHLKKHYETVYNSKQWKVIRSEMLRYFEQEYHDSPAIDGYHYIWMLKDNDKIPITFIPADTIGLHPKGEITTVYWKDIKGDLQQKEIKTIDVLACYQGKENWLYQNTQDIDLLKTILEKFEIPTHPYQNRQCPWEYNKEYVNPSALIAYYRHPVHNAGRYFSKHNPWMKENAPFTHTSENGNKRAILIKKAKELIGYIWVALSNNNIRLEPGFTIERNKKLFASVIAEANRGHNIDERPLYLKDQAVYNHIVQQNFGQDELIRQLVKSAEIQMTSADNMDEDLPTCMDGMIKRLLQCFYGHPHINAPEAQPLDPHLMLRRMEDHLIKSKEETAKFDNFSDKINTIVDKEILFYIIQQISDICELETFYESDRITLSEDSFEQYQSLINIPEKQKQAFLEQTKLWFGQERIEEKQAVSLKLDPTSNNAFLNKGHDFYEGFINFCMDNIIEAFSTTIYHIVNRRLQKLYDHDETFHKNIKPILYGYHNDKNGNKKDVQTYTDSQLEDELYRLDLRK